MAVPTSPGASEPACPVGSWWPQAFTARVWAPRAHGWLLLSCLCRQTWWLDPADVFTGLSPVQGEVQLCLFLSWIYFSISLQNLLALSAISFDFQWLDEVEKKCRIKNPHMTISTAWDPAWCHVQPFLLTCLDLPPASCPQAGWRPASDLCTALLGPHSLSL